ncbi:MAG: prepilin-type N-terminal cleavage/methylation domain-containing protein [Candidatus Jorgensenbacteria bacterium]|nr:prepilin-type N-terminal cleavage/methylation domain-containing protein [Candidatus Jorgensenbacteria bacterium]
MLNPILKYMHSNSRRRAFSLVELLIIVLIMSVLTVTVLSVLKPAELIKEARDSTRLSDLANINSALGVFSVSTRGVFLGNQNIVYVSIPDSTSTCANLGLPTLPTGWDYSCSLESKYRNVDGTGWIPANFSSAPAGSPFASLPIDPVNTVSGSFYTYSFSGGKWTLATAMEGKRNRLGGETDKTSTDSGVNVSLYEVGSSISLIPIDYGDKSLFGLWTFDDTGSTSVGDFSGGKHLGLLSPEDFHVVDGCHKGSCISHDGTKDYLNLPLNSYFGNDNAFTVFAWINTPSNGTVFGLTNKPPNGFGGWGASFLSVGENVIHGWVFNGEQFEVSKTRMSTSISNGWHLVALTYDPSGEGAEAMYVDGALVATAIGKYNVPLTPVVWTTYVAYNKPIKVSNYMSGRMDDVRLYTRALSGSEVLGVYNATR